nr:unnamed protein product [Digitaria exilis]
MAASNPSYYRSGGCQDIDRLQKEHLFHLYMNQRLEGTSNGMHIGAGKADGSWLLCHSILFTDTRFKGSSLKVLGDFAMDKNGAAADGEWAIVGGTGEFAYANGIVTAKIIENMHPTNGRIWELRIRAFCPCIPEVITLAPSETIKQVFGTKGTVEGDTVVTSLALVSNVRTYGPFGKANGSAFSSQIPGNKTVAGFHARAGASVNAFGLYIA